MRLCVECGVNPVLLGGDECADCRDTAPARPSARDELIARAAARGRRKEAEEYFARRRDQPDPPQP